MTTPVCNFWLVLELKELADQWLDTLAFPRFTGAVGAVDIAFYAAAEA